MTIQIDQNYLVSTLIDLVQINSINPSLVPGGAGEKEIAGYTAASLAQIGLEVSILESVPGRPSVVGALRGGSGRSLMLNAHYDTVGFADMDKPLSGTIRGGRLFGRGAYDMKSGLAVNMAVAKAFVDAGAVPAGDLVIAAVADEEYASIGTAEVIEQFPTDAAVVTEPTQLQICLAHKGFIWLNVDVAGRAAHGSRFDRGIDANIRMGRFLARLEVLEQTLRNQPGHHLVGPPSLHAAILRGGSELSAYAAHSRLQVERRTIPGESEDLVVSELQHIIDDLRSEDKTFSASVEPFFVRAPFETTPDSDIVQTLSGSASQILGFQPSFVGETPWMDSALLSDAGIDTVVMGPVGSGAHAKEEWVDLESLSSLAQILVQTALNYE